ncbi:aldolase/citrate lyase family protein [Bacteroides fragilis]
MFVPAHNERLLNSASRSDADVLILDIEDSVQPVSNKIVARNNIVKYISGNIFLTVLSILELMIEKVVNY